MPKIACHVYKNPFGTSLFVCQEATEETRADKGFSKIPVVVLDIPESGLQEMTDFFDDVVTPQGFVKSGLITEAEAEKEHYGDVLPLRLIAEGKATGFFVAPFARDVAGYKNPSRTFLFEKLPEIDWTLSE